MDTVQPGFLISVRSLNHYYGVGALRKQILFDINVDVRPGEIVILTGPSGSGKTTLLTLIGCLRAAQEGSLKVLGQELRDATEAALVAVRKNIGYIFQSHNLLESLSALQNVEMSLGLQADLSRKRKRDLALAALRAVGLENRGHQFPRQLSGGQRQRVAIARALVREPKLILADEPTASLDKKSGREVVELMQRLARERQCAVLLVTHDNRILDIADRTIHLEDGRVCSLSEAVAASSRQMLQLIARQNRKGDLTRQLRGLPAGEFTSLLDRVTGEFQQFLQVVEMSNHDAFDSMLEQVLDACAGRIGEILKAERVTLFLVDEDRGELWSKVAQNDGEQALDIRMPIGSGIAGRVAITGQTLNIPDAYQEPTFNRDIDKRTGYRTRSILCIPICNSSGGVFAVAQSLNKNGGEVFDRSDEQRFLDFAAPIGILLETWWRMRREIPRSTAAAAS